MSDKPACWFKQVADEFERVSKDVAHLPKAADKAKDLSVLAESIRADCGCGGAPDGGHRDGCNNAAETKE